MFIPAVIYSLLALVLIGMGDAINKKARQAGIPIGSYLLIQTPFFTCTILVITLLTTGIKVTSIDIWYSLAGAIISFAAFTLMLHSLTHGYASINYALFRLSFIFSSGIAILFLRETVTFGKGIGIILATCAILLFFYNPKQQIALKKSLVLALCAMLLNSCFQLTLKLATRVYSSSPSFVLLMSVFFSCLVIIYYIFLRYPAIPRKTFLYAPINGVLMSLGSLFVIIALSRGDVSTVTPIYQLSFLVTVILSITFLKERIRITYIIGIICAAFAVIILAWF